MAFVQLGSTGQQPTFFEMIATERLMPSLKAALLYGLSVYSQTRPNLLHLLDREDELFFLISILLERHSLRQNNASFAESLYALHRSVPPTHDNLLDKSNNYSEQNHASPVVLNHSQRRNSLILLTLLPYLGSKLDALYGAALSRSRHQQQTHLQRSSTVNPSSSMLSFVDNLSPRQKIALDVFVKAYPWVSSVHEAARFAYQLFYLLGKSPYFSPELHLVGLVVARVSGNDLMASRNWREGQYQQRLAQARQSPGGPLVQSLRQFWVKLTSAIGTRTRSALILAIFGYKLLEWWYGSAEQKLGGQQAPPPPPPPPPPMPSRQGVKLPEDASICPLCRRQRTNPAMIASSGYVYCYPCAFKFIESAGCCPVTRIPARIDQLRRLYPGSN